MEKKKIRIIPTGYGHWQISMEYYGKVISATTTNARAIDDYNSEDGDRDRGQLRRLRGHKSLHLDIVRAFKIARKR